jgi:cobalt/nickel transport system permease protein
MIVVALRIAAGDVASPLPPTLHAPDGFLSPAVAALMWILTLGVLWVAVRRADRNLSGRAILLMGVLAAFVFAAQMINFPVLGGTSGHLLGGVLVAILVGPWAATLVLTAVVGVQALLFQDGGLLAMGANIFNMGVIGTLGGYGIYRALASLPGGEARWRIPAAMVAAWVAIVAGAAAMAIQLGASGTTSLAITLPAMVGVHVFIGIGEALITAGALGFIALTRPDLLAIRHLQAFGAPAEPAGRTVRGRAWAVGGIAISAALVVVAAPLASTDPDGLERVAEDVGFLDRASEAAWNIMADYVVPGIEGSLSTILAGLIGIAIVVPIILGVGRLLARPRA